MQTQLIGQGNELPHHHHQILAFISKTSGPRWVKGHGKIKW